MKSEKKRIITISALSFSIILAATWHILVPEVRSILEEIRKPSRLSCNGSVETLFFSLPLRINLENERIEWNVNAKAITSLGKDYINFPDNLSGVNDIGVESSKGILAEWVDSNLISVKVWHTKGTLVLDRCTLELPITIDTVKALSKIIPMLRI